MLPPKFSYQSLESAINLPKSVCL